MRHFLTVVPNRLAGGYPVLSVQKDRVGRDGKPPIGVQIKLHHRFQRDLVQKFFYGITENKKSANEHLTQTMFFSVFAKQAGYVTIKTTSKMKEIRRINHVLWKLWETIK